MPARIILITGASSGIGAALARQYVRAGHRVAALARRIERLEQLQSVLPLKADVLNAAELSLAVETIHQKWGLIDTVIANAGFGVVGEIANLRLEDFQRQFDTNVWGVLRTLYATLPDLTETRGRFAVTGSVAGFISLPGGAPYSMSKFAVRALCDALYFELRPRGISVTHIAPGFVVSQIHQVDNLGQLHEHARHPMPDWIRVPTDTAAREIFRAIEARKRERIVTGHGKLLEAFFRYLPALFRPLIGRVGLKARQSASHSKS